MYRTCLLFISSLLTLCFFVISLPPDSYGEEPPINIEADHMSSTEKTNSVLFSGDVYVEQGDLEIKSDKMTVFYGDPEQKDGKKPVKTTQQIEKLICSGNVKLTREGWLGTADKMVYFAKKRQVVLSGNAQAWQDQNKVAGEKIVYYMDEGRSEVIGGSVTVGGEKKTTEKKRVKMTILQK
jgi:lipopolysaccharide export system protein LptA